MGLVTRTRAKQEKALSAVGNTLLTNLIEGASDWIERYTDRVFASAAYTEIQTGKNVNYLYVENPVINTFTSITVTDSSGGTETITAGNFVFDPQSGKITFGPDNASSYGVFPTWPERNLEISYNGGYDTIPDDVQEACIYAVTSMYAQTGRKNNPAFSEEKVGEHSYKIAMVVPLEEQPLIRTLLARYKRISI